MNTLAVILTNDLEPASPVAVTVALHQQGFEAATKTLDDGSIAFDLGSGAEMVIVHVPSPHPDAAEMPRGPTTPTPEAIAGAPAHIVIAALQLDHLVGPDHEAIDRAMLQIVCAVIGTTDAVGAMLGHGVYFHDPEILVTGTILFGEQGRLPPSTVVNITTGLSEAGRVTLLTHGLARYGRMELLVGCTTNMAASTAFVWQMVEWLMEDKRHRLVPGTLVPSDRGTEQAARAVPSPLGDGSIVVYVELGG